LRSSINWEALAGLRFSLACVVAFGHVRWFSGNADLFVEFCASLGGKAAVAGFLVVSGYSIMASLEHNQEGFYQRRFLRIYPLYFVALLFTLVLQTCLGKVSVSQGRTFVPDGPAIVVGNFLLLQTFVVKPVAFNGPVWSLSIEVFYYLLAPFFLRLPRGLLLFLIAVSAAVYLTPRSEEWGRFVYLLTRFNAAMYLWPWLLGFLYFRMLSPSACIALACAACAAIKLNDRVNPEPFAPLTLAVTLLLVGCARHLQTPQRARAVLDFLGDVSFPLYLFHLPAFLFGYAALGMRNPWALMGLAMFCSIAAYYVVDVYLKPRVVTPLLYRLAGPRRISSLASAAEKPEGVIPIHQRDLGNLGSLSTALIPLTIAMQKTCGRPEGVIPIPQRDLGDLEDLKGKT
jgi:peptidoglycan/LPS O-acetylase OafA/YrhL